MSGARTVATAARVLSQLRRDPRTIVLLIAVPCVLILLVDQLFSGREQVFQSVGVPMLGIFPLISMFLVTSITMLRERTTGTLERLLTTPLTKLELLLGYGIAFAAVAVVQVTVVSLVGFVILGLDTVHSNLLIVLLAVANALLGMAFGLFVSAFARSEFQAVQFMPAFVLPQILLYGLFVARDQMGDWLQWVSAVLPLTYAFDALDRAAHEPTLGPRFWADVTIVVGAMILALVLGAATLRRRTP
ncbi:MAG: ABC transporter permease [Thermoleophilia bacterium]|nr:ABC transporter permease [Thermoleophilia bacterium]